VARPRPEGTQRGDVRHLVAPPRRIRQALNKVAGVTGRSRNIVASRSEQNARQTAQAALSRLRENRGLVES
jgi:hypothetical protein